jgi:hypothetical protein
MEFEKDTRASDADRRLAEAKKLTLEPLHADIAPEAEPEAEVVARHLADGALANIPIDTEQTSTPLQPSQGLIDSAELSSQTRLGPKPSFVIKVILVVVGAIAIGLAITNLR